MKKFWLFLLFSFIAVLVFWIFIRPRLITEANIYQGQKLLSDRGKTFLDSQQQDGKEKWLYVDFTNETQKNKVLGKKILRVEPCYEFEIPFRIKFVRKDQGVCHRFISLDEPRSARIIIYQDEREFKGFEEVPDIIMRRLPEQGYLEEKWQLNDDEFLIFKKTEGNYEANAFVFHSSKLYIINFITFTQADFDPKFKEMLQSLQFIN